jgi:hypothetical protein
VRSHGRRRRHNQGGEGHWEAMRALSSRPFCSCDSRGVSLRYLAAGCRYTARSRPCGAGLLPATSRAGPRPASCSGEAGVAPRGAPRHGHALASAPPGRVGHQREGSQVARDGRTRPAERPFEFPSMLPLLSSSLEYFSSPPIFFGAVSPGPDRSGGFLWRWDLASPTTFYPCGFKHPSPDSLYVF